MECIGGGCMLIGSPPVGRGWRRDSGGGPALQHNEDFQPRPVPGGIDRMCGAMIAGAGRGASPTVAHGTKGNQ